MRFEPRKLDIAASDPFASDAANLQSYADSLTNVFRNTEGSCVAALDAPWGQGKTTFLDMWRYSYKNEGGKVIWFNAWTNDHCEDILIALIDELGRQLETDSGSKAKLGALKKNAKDIIVRTIPLAARVATGGLVEMKGVGEFVEKMAQQKLDDYAKAKESIHNFKQELQAFIEKNSADDLPVVVVIDELDRCRPSFAIETLETIKHLFEVDNLIFVLGVDLQQLEHAIRGVYGAGFSSDVYLHRFFNIRLSLPEPPVEPMVKSFLQRLDLTEELGKKSRGYLYSKSNIPDVLAECARQFDFSLRDLERVVTTLGLFTAAVPDGKPVFPNTATVLATLRHKHRTLYESARKQKMDGREFWVELSKQHFSRSFCYSNPGRVLMCELILALDGKEGLLHFSSELQNETKVSVYTDNYEERNHADHITQISEGMRQSIGILNRPFLLEIAGKLDFLSKSD